MSVVRQCYICWESDGGLGDSEWVSPCRCTGTMRWVHKSCILYWVRSQSNDFCLQCRTPYCLSPPKEPLLLAMEYFENRMCRWIEDIVAVCVLPTYYFQVAFTALGFFTLTQVNGLNETFNFLSTSNCEEVLSKLEVTSTFFIVVSLIQWEHLFLKALYSMARLPVLRLVLPRVPTYQLSLMPTNESLIRIISRSVLLPVCGRICGNIFFNNVRSNLYRVILGGISYLTIKTVVRMYCTHKRLTWLDQVDILPVPNYQVYLPDILPVQNVVETNQENIHDDGEVSEVTEPDID